MNVLLSIKPKYVEEIAKGNKKYEFRKSIFKNNDVHRAYIYSTSPIKKIVGVFTIGEIVSDLPERLWDRFCDKGGITRESFFAYFGSREHGFAIEIQSVEFFDEPIKPEECIDNFFAPQSFCYMNDHLFEN